LPDARYNSLLISRFVNKLMMRGKKGLAESILYNTIDELEKRAKRPGLEVFEQAIRNATPVIEVKPRRVGGATYQVPVEIKGDRRQSLAIRWVLAAARKRSGKSMVDRLAAELMDASNNVGTTIKKREDTHRMAEANRAFAHYRF
jgi:small subunit ribosomal protein S7